MILRLKESLRISTNYLSLSVMLNVLGWLAVYLHPNIGNDIAWYESVLMSLLCSVLMFILLIIFGFSRAEFVIPLVYLGLSLLLTINNEMYGFDLLYVLNFGFSQFCYFLYSVLRGLNLLMNPLIDKIVFYGLFFSYQFVLIYFAKRSSLFGR